jgi:predicted permease
VLFFSLDLSDANYSGPRRANLDREVIEEIRAMPGVYSASLCWMTPISGGVGTSSVVAEGYVPRADEDMTMYMNTVGSGFFETLGTPLLLGRDFSRQDTVRSPKVALINETMARDFFLNQNPIGKRFGPGWDDSKGQGGYTIIGVVKDAKYVTLRERIHRTAYVYCFQDPEYLWDRTFAVRAQGSPMALIPQVRAILQRIDRSLPEPTFWSFSQQIDESLRQERLLATLSSCFGLLALVLSSIGLFGLFSYAVTRRTPEIGIRMAIGAPPGSIRWMILRETLWLLLAGLAIGLPATLAASRVVSSILFGVAPNDPVTLAATMMLLAGVAIFTGYWPARKASKVDPMVALHYE